MKCPSFLSISRAQPIPTPTNPSTTLIADAEKNRPEVAIYKAHAEVQKEALKDINSELLPILNMYGAYPGSGPPGRQTPFVLSVQSASQPCPLGFTGMFQNLFNYSSPEYQVGITLAINLRNRQAKADQFRAVLPYRQSQISFRATAEEHPFRRAQLAIRAAAGSGPRGCRSRRRAIWPRTTFDITEQEQKLGAKSSYDTLVAQHDLAIAESAFVAAQTAYEKAKVDIDRATGETLRADRTFPSMTRNRA